MNLLELNQQQQNSNGVSDFNPDLIASIGNTKAGLLAINRQDKINRLGAQVGTINTDGDSGDTWRLAGADAPEVYHDNVNERNKVYQQYAQVNNVPMEMAKQQVDAEALAVKTAKDNGYDLPKQIEEARATGAMDANYQPTSFDIYRLGDRATQYANQDQINNPGQGLLNSKFTGQTDMYNRALVENKDFTDRAIKSGYYVPGSLDPTEFAKQQALMNQAQSNGQGLYDTAVNRTLMNNMNKNSYANHVNTPEQPQYNTNSDISTAALSSIGVMGATVGDALADAGTAIARNILKSNTPNTISPEEKLAMANTKLKELIDKSALGEYFNTKQGQVNFSGLDEAKKTEYWGYEQSQELKNTSKELSDAYKSGNIFEMGKALASTILKPEVALEVVAGSLGEIGIAATGVGTALLIAGKTNDMLETRREITGKPSTNEDIAYATSMGIVYALVNRFTGGNAAIGTIKEATKSLTKNMTEVGLISTAQVLKDIAKGAGKAYGIEGGEEIIQDLAIEVGNKLGTSKENEILNKENQAQLFTAFGLGATAGGMTHATVDVPRKTYEAYRNNKPLNEIITTANNLSNEDRNLVLDELNNTKDIVNRNIQENQDSVTKLENIRDNEPNNYVQTAGSILDAIPEIKVDTHSKLQKEISTLLNGTDETTKTMSANVVDNLLNKYNDLLSQPDLTEADIQESTQVVDKLNSIKSMITNNNLDSNAINQLTTEVLSDIDTKDIVNKLLVDLKKTYASNGIDINVNTVNDIFKTIATKDNINKAISSLNTSSANMNKDLGILDFKQKELEKASIENPTELINQDITQDFNAKSILESGKLNSLISGVKNARNELNKYSTETLQKLEEDAKVNASKVKNVNKLRSAITTILRTRAQAEKSEGFKSTKTATDIFKEYTGKGADTTSSLLKAVRVPSMSAQEATVFKGIVEQLRADEKISETASNNLISRINKISDVIIPTNNTEQATTQNEPVQPTSTIEPSKENTQEISDSIQTDMTLAGLELKSTDPEVIKQALELSGIIQTMCK